MYLPSSKASDLPDEGYYDFHTGKFYESGQRVTVATPDEHIATLVRAGSVIPIGKPCATVTSRDGLSSTTADGTRIKLVSDGGVVELDDWRGVEIYPPPSSKGSATKWSWEWSEDDGESLVDEKLKITKVQVEYSVNDQDEVEVKARWVKRDFETLWDELWVVLPMGDGRKVRNGSVKEVRGRTGFVVSVA